MNCINLDSIRFTHPRQDDCTVALDVAELYPALARRLEQIVRLDVQAPEAVIEDACQFAWTCLINHAGCVKRDAALSWLATTAVREAVRMARRERRELSLDAAGEVGIPCVTRAPGPDELAECGARLDLIRWLPERQQRILWLHALGFSYREIAHHTDCTTRTVERQLLRAKRTVRTLAAA